MTTITFNPPEAERSLRERLDSLERDTNRCYTRIEGMPPAPFPAVLYAFATIDYLSSCWQGWNDSKGDPAKKQTVRIADFLEQVCHYGWAESQIAVALWRHKLMHTGEPRLLRDTATNEVYGWEINFEGKDHMALVGPGGARGRVFHINPRTLVKDLREAVFGAGGYWDQLQASPDLQAKFVAFMYETDSYTVKIRI
jgi:hypothetical protein